MQIDLSSISSNSMTMTDEVVSESHRDPFANDFDDGSIGPGRISAMSVEDDGSSFILSQSFGGSTVTELSSVFSMSEDDFDKMASRHARFLFDEIDSMLYEHQTNGPPYLVKECHEWRTEFPHLRVLGQQVIDRQEEGFHLYPTMNLAPNGMEDISRTLESKDLLVHGKHFDMTQLNMGVGSLGLSHPEGAMPLEEILEENGTIEEILAIDYKTGEDECQKLGPNKRSNGRPPITPFNCVKDNIISALFNHVLKEVAPLTKPLLERLLANAGEKGTTEELPCGESTDDVEISLLSNRYSEKNSRSSSFGASVLSAVPEDTPLGGLLTIRSKTLLNRERTLGLLDGITENLHGQTAVPSIRLNPVMFGSSHLSERRSSLNRIKLSPLENNRLQSLVPPGEVDHATNANLDGLRGHRFATLTSQSSSTPTPKLPPLQNQRAIMSANVPNTNINRSMQPRSKLLAKYWRPGSVESARNDRPKLRPFYCHPIARTHNLSREPVKCSNGLTKPSTSQPITKPQLELQERYRQKSTLETQNRSGRSWNDPDEVQSRKHVSSLVSQWVEDQNPSGHVPGAHGLVNTHCDKERHAGVGNKIQNFIGKTCTDDCIQKHEPNAKTGKSVVGSFQNMKSVGGAAITNGYIQKPCSKIVLNAPSETRKLGIGDFSRGIRMHEIAGFSRLSQMPKIGSVYSRKQNPDFGETLNNAEVRLRDGRIQVGYTAHGNNSVKDMCGCERLLYPMPSKLPRPCSVKKDCCGNLVEYVIDRGCNRKLRDTSDGETVSQNNRKIGKAGRSPVMRLSRVTDDKADGYLQCKANDGFGYRTNGECCEAGESRSSDRLKVKFSVMTDNRGFDMASNDNAGSGFLDKASNRISRKSVEELSDKAKNKFCCKSDHRGSDKIDNEKANSTFFDKAKHKFHIKDSYCDKADDDKADSGFFDKANIGLTDKAGSTFRAKAEYRDSDKSNGDKIEGEKVDRIFESVDRKSVGNASVKLNDKANNRLLGRDSIKSDDSVSRGAVYKTQSRFLTSESFDKAAGKYRVSRFSDKAVTRSDKKSDNSLFSEANKLIYGTDSPFIIKDHSRLVDITDKANGRLIDKANSRSTYKDHSRLIDKVNSRPNDKAYIRSSDNDQRSFIDKSDSVLFPNRREARRVPHRELIGASGKQNIWGSTKPDVSVTAVTSRLQASHVRKPCSSLMTKIQRTECPYSIVTLKNTTAKSYGSVTLKNYKVEKSSSSVCLSSHKTCKTEKPCCSVVPRNCRDAIGSSSCSSLKINNIEKPLNSLTPKDCKYVKSGVPVSRRNRTLCQNGRLSPSKIPRPVKEPTGPHLSEISHLADVIPQSWARVMQPFLELLKMSGKEVLCRKSVDCTNEKLNQQIRSKIPRPCNAPQNTRLKPSRCVKKRNSFRV